MRVTTWTTILQRLLALLVLLVRIALRLLRWVKVHVKYAKLGITLICRLLQLNVKRVVPARLMQRSVLVWHHVLPVLSAIMVTLLA